MRMSGRRTQFDEGTSNMFLLIISNSKSALDNVRPQAVWVSHMKYSFITPRQNPRQWMHSGVYSPPWCWLPAGGSDKSYSVLKWAPLIQRDILYSSADTTPGSRVSLHVPSFPFTRRNVFSGSQFKVSETDIKSVCHKVLVDNETNKTKQSHRATYVTPVTHVALGDCSLEWEWIPFTLKPEN